MITHREGEESKVIMYEYRLEKDGKFHRAGRTGNVKYIENLIKYKGRREKKRHTLSIVKGNLVGEKGSYKLDNVSKIFR